MKKVLSSVGVVCGVVCVASTAWGFDYLEHAYFTDDACHRVQRKLLASFERDDKPVPTSVLARYVALSLFCPSDWERPYCGGGYKQLQGHINVLEEPAYKSHDYGVTLGDYAALPDHLSKFGPIKNLARAGDDGLVEQTWEWISESPRTAGGVIEDVAEDACETDGLSPWGVIKGDVDAYLARLAVSQTPERVPEDYLSPIMRADVPKGPSDPAGAYSFDNPHYLDLVLRNHHHFGVQAYSSWLGFHSAAVQIAGRPCEQTVALDADALEDMADGVKGFDEVDWDALSSKRRGPKACSLLKHHTRAHVARWRARHWAARHPKVSQALDGLFFPTMDPVRLVYQEIFLDQIVSSISALVMEGSGLHFLQDGLASGHMRTIRTRGGLQEVRYDHDRDNRDGVVAIYRTRKGSYPFVAFGDTYLLAPALTGRRACDWSTFAATSPTRAEVTTCLIQQQRGMLTSVSMASLLDWVFGGTMYKKPVQTSAKTPGSKTAQGAACTGTPLEQFTCSFLPVGATMVAGEELPVGHAAQNFHHGALPVPPPPFSYEALTVRMGLDIAGDALQLKLTTAFLSELDDVANWLTSTRVGVGLTVGELDRDQIFIDAGYHFHWRWAARFLIDAGLSGYTGLRNFQQEDISFFMGVAPVVGITLLPEGWVKMPLEVALSYRLPLTFFASDEGFPDRVLEGHWFYVGFGLAFMR